MFRCDHDLTAPSMVKSVMWDNSHGWDGTGWSHDMKVGFIIFFGIIVDRREIVIGFGVSTLFLN